MTISSCMGEKYVTNIYGALFVITCAEENPRECIKIIKGKFLYESYAK